MRIIDADALKRHYSWWKGGTREMTMDEAKNDFDTIIDLQPTIEPKRGRWIYNDCQYGRYWFKCDQCKELMIIPTRVCQPLYNFCPNCGSRNRQSTTSQLKQEGGVNDGEV